MRRAILAVAVALSAWGPGGDAHAQCETKTLLEIPLVYGTLYYEDTPNTGEFYIYFETNDEDGLQRRDNLIERTAGIDMGPMFEGGPCTEPAGESDLLIGKSCASPSDYFDVPTCIAY